MQSAPVDGRPFIDRLKSALEQLGFVDVFVDTAEIKAGDHFEGRIHRAIANCDVFVPLIGKRWMHLLTERIESGERDVLSREIATAFRLERDIVPLLIDGADMPRANELPGEISQLANVDGEPVASDASAERIAATLSPAAHQASRARRLGSRWSATYAAAAFAVWIFCGIVPNLVGLNEFGYEAWFGLATTWSGMFIWPIFFLPFIMLGLFRPFRTLIEATLNAGSIRDWLSYGGPIAFGTLFAVVVTFIEVGPPQVPWTVHPQLMPSCTGGPPDTGPSDPGLLRQYNDDRHTLASYGASGVLPKSFEQKFWMRNKCWPDVFFYMALPAEGSLQSDAYGRERASVQDAFLRILGAQSTDLKGTDAPFSRLFPFYVISIFLMLWLLVIAILMAIIYATYSIRRPNDGRILLVPTEDAFLCLTYAFITLIVWVPFRMTTDNVKMIYYCTNVQNGCGPTWEIFSKDAIFGLALLTGYVALTAGILWNHRRLLLGFIGTVAVSLMALCAVAVLMYRDVLLQLTGHWQFWLAVSLLACLMLTALWYQYDPAIVRLRDFQQGVRRRHTG